MNRRVIDTAADGRPAPADPAPAVVDEEATQRRRRKEEFRTWFFLTFVMAPVLAVAIVSAYGLAVWFYQLFVGPPGS